MCIALTQCMFERMLLCLTEKKKKQKKNEDNIF